MPTEAIAEKQADPVQRLETEVARRTQQLQQANQALRETEHRLNLALETGGLGYYERNLTTNEIICNPRWLEIMGLRPGPLDPDVAPKSLYPEDRARVLERVARAFDPHLREVCGAEFRIVTPSGEVKWVSGHGRVTFDDSVTPPRPLKFLGVLRDVTELKQWQARLAAANEQLETKVEERTEKLRQAIADLQHFSHTITHDLRGPLRAMEGFAEILMEESKTKLTDAENQYISRIIGATARMDHLITDALNYSKLANQDLELAPVDVERLLREMIDTYPEFNPSTIDIDIKSPLLPVIGNKAAITQCFSNLLSNAVKFAKPGQKPQLVIRSEDQHQRVRLWFEDNGIGIAPEYQNQIFGMFTQLNSRVSGTGVGLALVRKSTERMGGTVGVDSEPGKGSRFWIELSKAPPK